MLKPSSLRFVLDYLRLFWPPLFRKFVARLDAEAYSRGWNVGFDKGHLRGWLDLRGRINNRPDKYPHVKPSDRS